MTHDSFSAGLSPLAVQRQHVDIASAADHLQGDLLKLSAMLGNHTDDCNAILLLKRVASASSSLEATWRRRDALDSSAADSEFDVRSEETATIEEGRVLRDQGIDFLTQLHAGTASADERRPSAGKT